MRFLRPSKCSLQAYANRLSLQVKCNRDMFGFLRTTDYLNKEKLQKDKQIKYVNQRDLHWITYLKSIGGVENLKPAGTSL